MLTSPVPLLRTGFRLTRVLKQVLIVLFNVCLLVHLSCRKVLVMSTLLMLCIVSVVLKDTMLANIVELNTVGAKCVFLLPAYIVILNGPWAWTLRLPR